MKIILMYQASPETVEKVKTVTTVGVTIAAASFSSVAEAAGVTEKIAKASQPIKDLMLGLADPVCYLVFAWGLLECMLGKASSGISRIKYATLGYLGMYWIPVFMNVLRGARP